MRSVEKLIRIFATIILVALVATSAILLLNLVNFVKTDTEILVSHQQVKVGSPVTIEVPRFNRLDRIYLVLNATIPVHNITVQPEDALIHLPMDVEGSAIDIAYPIMITRHFFFVANTSGRATLVMHLQPKTPYAIKDFEGRAYSTVFSYIESGREYMGINIKVVKFRENGYAQTILVVPFNEIIQPDFQVQGELKVLEGRIAYVNLIIMTDTDLYAVNIAPLTTQPNLTINFNVNACSRELFNRTGEYLGKRGVYLALGIGLYEGQFSADETPQATLAIGNVTIVNSGKNITVSPKVLYEYDLYYRLYIFRKFQPTYEHFLLVSSLVLEVLAFNYIAIKLWKNKIRR